jgi:hypothetical protein
LLRQKRYAKKGDAKSLPCGFPPVQVKKWEMKQTRCAQTASFLIHFLPCTSGSATCGRRTSKHPWCDFRLSTHAMPKHIALRQSAAFESVFDLAFELGFESVFDFAFDLVFDPDFD